MILHHVVMPCATRGTCIQASAQPHVYVDAHYISICATHTGMSLSEEQFRSVVENLRLVEEARRWLAFNALRPLLRVHRVHGSIPLSDDEMDTVFNRVEHVLRYVTQLARDHAALGRVHMHKISCGVLSIRHII